MSHEINKEELALEDPEAFETLRQEMDKKLRAEKSEQEIQTAENEYIFCWLEKLEDGDFVINYGGGLSDIANCRKDSIMAIFRAEGSYISPILLENSWSFLLNDYLQNGENEKDVLSSYRSGVEEERGRIVETMSMRGKYLLVCSAPWSYHIGFAEALGFCNTLKELKRTLALFYPSDISGIFRVDKEEGIVEMTFKDIFGTKL